MTKYKRLTTIPPIYRVLGRCRISESGCWEFQGYRNKVGYGSVSVGSRLDGTKTIDLVHRITYRHFLGPISDGLTVDHLCRNKSCCNPDHLEAVTLQENIRRGESPTIVLARKNVCRRGHSLLDPDNLLNTARGRRCKTCSRIANREATERRRASRYMAEGADVPIAMLFTALSGVE